MKIFLEFSLKSSAQSGKPSRSASAEVLKNSTLISPEEVSKNAEPGLPVEEKYMRLSKKSFSSLRALMKSSEPFFMRMKLFLKGFLSYITAVDDSSAASFDEETSDEHEAKRITAVNDKSKYFKSVFPS